MTIIALPGPHHPGPAPTGPTYGDAPAIGDQCPTTSHSAGAEAVATPKDTVQAPDLVKVLACPRRATRELMAPTAPPER